MSGGSARSLLLVLCLLLLAPPAASRTASNAPLCLLLPRASLSRVCNATVSNLQVRDFSQLNLLSFGDKGGVPQTSPLACLCTSPQLSGSCRSVAELTLSDAQLCLVAFLHTLGTQHPA